MHRYSLEGKALVRTVHIQVPIKIIGKITIVSLGESIHFVYERGLATLRANVRVPDHEIHQVARWLSKHIRRTVIWQDINGISHWIDPESKVQELVHYHDPRSRKVLKYASST